jgi:gluconate 5-dehydrogenase
MSARLFDLTGRRALVTGSGSGIGLALAKGLAASGAKVVLNGRDAAKLEAAKADIPGATAHVFDVTDTKAVAAGIERIEAEEGPIDILVNNAGIQRRAPLDEISEETWREVMATNLDAVFFVGKEVAKRMIPRRQGKIINICSLTSDVARPTITPYATAKGGVRMMTKGMCADWAKHGLQINGIGPGYFKTPMNKALIENQEFNAWVEKRTPAGRWGEVEELQGVCIFLASDASSFVNGQIFYVDGGLLAVF